MNILKWLFPKDKPLSQSDFSIEFYPITNRYYPKYKKKYLRKSYSTGIVESIDEFLFPYADHGKSEEEAYRIINLFKEQQLKENVITIKK